MHSVREKSEASMSFADSNTILRPGVSVAALQRHPPGRKALVLPGEMK
jgi:hypothetical protein